LFLRPRPFSRFFNDLHCIFGHFSIADRLYFFGKIRGETGRMGNRAQGRLRARLDRRAFVQAALCSR
jgi:hypothetical protein